MILCDKNGNSIFEITEVKVDNFHIYGPYRVINSAIFNKLVSMVEKEVDQILFNGSNEYDFLVPPSDGEIDIRIKP